MGDEKKSKDLKDLSSWDDGLGKIKEGQSTDSSKEPAPKPVSKPATPERLPSSAELEDEWTKKIKEARKDNKEVLPTKAALKKRVDSIQDVFTQLKKEDAAAVKASKDTGRLGKIGSNIRGEAPELKERELSGQDVSGLYKIYAMGSIPPLNLLSKLFYNISGSSLERDLKVSGIPLYDEEYVDFSVAMAFIFSILGFILIFILTQFNIVFALLAAVLSLFLIGLLMVNLPSLQSNSGSRNIDRQLPFALRHMSSLLSAGISIFDSIVSVSKADYGPLSKELDKVVWDVKSGENLSEALSDSAERMNSASYTRVTVHIKRALQMGGDVASIIEQIADDLTFEMRMKISDFVEKLNAFAIVYLVGGIVGPVVIAVFAVVSSASPLSGSTSMMDPQMLMFMIFIVFPLLMGVITYVVKLMEPKV
jgi:flagellar protein FlaJ